MKDTVPDYLVDGSPGMEGHYRVLRVECGVSDEDAEGAREWDDFPVYDLNFPVSESGRPTRNDYPFLTGNAVRGNMPDVSGLSMREAFQILLRKGLNVKIVGMGRVTKQEPAAGEEYLGRELCVLWGENR